MNRKHELHMVGFLSDCLLPIIRMNGAAAPAKGAAHIWQRGPCGRRLKMPRTRRSFGSPRVRKSRQNSSLLRSGAGP